MGLNFSSIFEICVCTEYLIHPLKLCAGLVRDFPRRPEEKPRASVKAQPEAKGQAPEGQAPASTGPAGAGTPKHFSEKS